MRYCPELGVYSNPCANAAAGMARAKARARWARGMDLTNMPILLRWEGSGKRVPTNWRNIAMGTTFRLHIMAESITLELLYPDARAPERATEDSAGYDLFVHLTHRTVSCSDSSGTWELPTLRDREKSISYFD